MDNQGNLADEKNTALVIFAFLQSDCFNLGYDRELLSLHAELTLDKNYNCSRIDDLDYGKLETDGHLPSSITLSLDDIQPSLELYSEYVKLEPGAKC